MTWVENYARYLQELKRDFLGPKSLLPHALRCVSVWGIRDYVEGKYPECLFLKSVQISCVNGTILGVNADYTCNCKPSMLNLVLMCFSIVACLV